MRHGSLSEQKVSSLVVLQQVLQVPQMTSREAPSDSSPDNAEPEKDSVTGGWPAETEIEIALHHALDNLRWEVRNAQQLLLRLDAMQAPRKPDHE